MELLWDVRISLDLFLGGLGIGAFLMGAIFYYIDVKAYEALIKKAFIIAPLLVMGGLLSLLSELGRPMNIVKTLYEVNPTSFMSIGIFLQGAFLLVSLFLAFQVLVKGATSLSSGLVYAGAILAGLIGLYHGFILTGIGKEPWNNALPVMFFVSSVLAGSSLALLLSMNNIEEIANKFKLPIVINMILTLELGVVSAWVYNLALNTASSKHAYEVLMESFVMEFWVWSILVGLIIPLILFTLVVLEKISFKAVFIPAAASIVVGSFFLKNLIVYLGQAV